MTGNGLHERRKEELHLLEGASAIDKLREAANALIMVSRVFDTIRIKVGDIGADTARALSETFELRKHLKAITEREQSLLAERAQREKLLEEELVKLRAKCASLEKSIPKIKRRIKRKKGKGR